MMPEQLTPEMQRLVALIESNLFYIAKNVQTREQAMAIRSAFQAPLGVMNSRFGLASNSASSKRLTSVSQKA